MNKRIYEFYSTFLFKISQYVEMALYTCMKSLDVDMHD